MTGQSVHDLVLAKKLLTQEQLEQILQPDVLTMPRAFAITAAVEKAEMEKVGPSQID